MPRLINKAECCSSQARQRLPHGLKLDNEFFALQTRALNARTASIRIGDLEYMYKYTLDPNSCEEAAFQLDKYDCFDRFLNAPPPIEFISNSIDSNSPRSERLSLAQELLVEPNYTSCRRIKRSFVRVKVNDRARRV